MRFSTGLTKVHLHTANENPVSLLLPINLYIRHDTGALRNWCLIDTGDLNSIGFTDISCVSHL